MSETHTCIHSQEIAELKRDAERNSEQHREFYNKFNEITTKQAIADERYNNILVAQNETKAIVTELKDKPARKWDNLSWLVISSIVGIIVGYVFGGIL